MASAALWPYFKELFFIFRVCRALRSAPNAFSQKGLSALVYTQLTDVEDEVNGLFTYDRTAIKPDANAVRSVNAALAAEFARVVK